jgi:hypothetical protein
MEKWLDANGNELKNEDLVISLTQGTQHVVKYFGDTLAVSIGCICFEELKNFIYTIENDTYISLTFIRK